MRASVAGLAFGVLVTVRARRHLQGLSFLAHSTIFGTELFGLGKGATAHRTETLKHRRRCSSGWGRVG